MHSQCKSVYRNVADILRKIEADKTIDSELRHQAKLVGMQVIFAGHRILMMEESAGCIKDRYIDR